MSLVIKNLHAKVQGTEILKGINLEIPKGEVHAIMGPNGSGKSTLSKVLCGHPDYEVTEGEAWLDGQNLLDMSIDERSRAGLFLAFQYPMEVPGVSNANFLRAAMQARMPVLHARWRAQGIHKHFDIRMGIISNVKHITCCNLQFF